MNYDHDQMIRQMDNLLKSIKERIDFVMEEDKIGDVYHDERSEAILEEWWEWIDPNSDKDNDILFVPQQLV